MRAVPLEMVASLVAMSLLSAAPLARAQGHEACSAPRIEQVMLIRHDVFLRSEAASGLPRLANKLHVKTRESVIARELLFAAGDRLDPERLAQTERNLRARPFLSDVRIDVLGADGSVLATAARASAPDAPLCDLLRGATGVDVRVMTRDAWSTSVETTLRQAGDRTIWELGVEESNFLGRGKTLGVAHRDDIDRNSDRLVYEDHQLAGTRHRLLTEYADQSDGARLQLEVGRPFHSLDDRWSWRLRLESFDQRQPLYRHGRQVERLRHVRRHQELEVSRLLSRGGNRAVRAHAAVRRLGDEVAGRRRDFRLVELGLSSVEHRYVQLRYVDHERPLDLNLGDESYLRLGVSMPFLGSSGDTATFLEAGHRRGVRLGERRYLVGEASWSGRLREGGVENGWWTGRATFLDRSLERRVSVARVRLESGTNLDPERQITLGADSGLRGYPVHQWVGTRSLLLGLEHRWFFADDVLELASLGVAAFVDSGYAWPDGMAVDAGDLRTNVGVSLLVGRKRLSSADGAMRIDLAYALDPLEDRGRWLLSFGRLIDLD